MTDGLYGLALKKYNRGIMELFDKMKKLDLNEKWIKWIAVIVFTVITIVTSWNSDDAYHAFIMAKNLVEGNGLVYNVGYRVTASTCPLYTLLTALIYVLLGADHMYFAGIIGGVVFSFLAVYILVFKMCKTKMDAVMAVTILLVCYCFMTYTTAGLENSLLFFLAALFLKLYLNKDEFSLRELLGLALIFALMATTRVDSVLIFIPAICIGYLFDSKIGFLKKIGIGVCGLLPFIIWELFSLFYYGFFFPNTMYIKLNTGFPESDYLTRGFDFLYRSFLTDSVLLIVPIVFFCISTAFRNRKLISVSAGCLLYIVYVVYIGGDFMVGRHLTLPFFVSFMGIIAALNSENEKVQKNRFPLFLLSAFLLAEVISVVFVRPVARESFYEQIWDLSVTGVADEKRYYHNVSGFVPYVFSSKPEGGDFLKYYYSWSDVRKYSEMRENKIAGNIEDYLPGIKNYNIQEDGTLYMTDIFGLMDPLLSHLPAVREENWRIGHMKREIPEGYAESVAAGKNLIVNESLHEYYDKILLIITGDLWDKERLSTIVKMNLGEYDYLIEEYLNAK